MKTARAMKSRLSLLVPVTLSVALIAAGCKSNRPEPESTPAPASTADLPKPAATVQSAKPAGSSAQNQPAPPAVPPPEDVAAPPADAKKMPSGVAYKVLTPGTGKKRPKITDRVKVHFSGWTTSGKLIDSSIPRGQPSTLSLEQAPPVWKESLEKMLVGEKRRLWSSSKLAYGPGQGQGAPGGDLVFELELVEILESLPPPAVPKDVKAPPKTAKKTASGLAYALLKKGTGTQSPTAANRVRVHYTGWTTDGKMFDSSVTRGEPTTFPLGNVIKGWTEGVQLMKAGDKMRFWIPPELAYGATPSKPGAPAGMLVFDIELLDIM